MSLGVKVQKWLINIFQCVRTASCALRWIRHWLYSKCLINWLSKQQNFRLKNSFNGFIQFWYDEYEKTMWDVPESFEPGTISHCNLNNIFFPNKFYICTMYVYLHFLHHLDHQNDTKLCCVTWHKIWCKLTKSGIDCFVLKLLSSVFCLSSCSVWVMHYNILVCFAQIQFL